MCTIIDTKPPWDPKCSPDSPLQHVELPSEYMDFELDKYLGREVEQYIKHILDPKYGTDNLLLPEWEDWSRNSIHSHSPRSPRTLVSQQSAMSPRSGASSPPSPTSPRSPRGPDSPRHRRSYKESRGSISSVKSDVSRASRASLAEVLKDGPVKREGQDTVNMAVNASLFQKKQKEKEKEEEQYLARKKKPS